MSELQVLLTAIGVAAAILFYVHMFRRNRRHDRQSDADEPTLQVKVSVSENATQQLSQHLIRFEDAVDITAEVTWTGEPITITEVVFESSLLDAGEVRPLSPSTLKRYSASRAHLSPLKLWRKIVDRDAAPKNLPSNAANEWAVAQGYLKIGGSTWIARARTEDGGVVAESDPILLHMPSEVSAAASAYISKIEKAYLDDSQS